MRESLLIKLESIRFIVEVLSTYHYILPLWFRSNRLGWLSHVGVRSSLDFFWNLATRLESILLKAFNEFCIHPILLRARRRRFFDSSYLLGKVLDVPFHIISQPLDFFSVLRCFFLVHDDLFLVHHDLLLVLHCLFLEHHDLLLVLHVFLLDLHKLLLGLLSKCLHKFILLFASIGKVTVVTLLLIYNKCEGIFDASISCAAMSNLVTSNLHMLVQHIFSVMAFHFFQGLIFWFSCLMSVAMGLSS